MAGIGLSADDIDATRQLCEAASATGLQFLGHVVVTETFLGSRTETHEPWYWYGSPSRGDHWAAQSASRSGSPANHCRPAA